MRMYGEILFVGKCNYKCYYCLGYEMNRLQRNDNSCMSKHFNEWKNFNEFISKLKDNGVDTVYLSSTIAEPLLYRYFDELVEWLIERGFRVGLRTNASMALNHIDTILKMNEEISLSMNSLFKETAESITGVQGKIDWVSLFNTLDEHDKKVRVSIVVNQYNENEIEYTLDELSNYRCISYVQLRKVYKYYKYNECTKDTEAFDRVEKMLELGDYEKEWYYESKGYKVGNLRVFLWENVFKEESMRSINYFTDGLITDDVLLVPAYEERK